METETTPKAITPEVTEIQRILSRMRVWQAQTEAELLDLVEDLKTHAAKRDGAR